MMPHEELSVQRASMTPAVLGSAARAPSRRGPVVPTRMGADEDIADLRLAVLSIPEGKAPERGEMSTLGEGRIGLSA